MMERTPVHNYVQILQNLYQTVQPIPDTGQVASYIPELACIDPNQFGGFLQLLDGDGFGFGDYQIKFSIQSVAKVFALTLAYREIHAELWDRLGVEPSGSAFNSLVQLEYEQGKPRNPFINAGALVICDVLINLYDDAASELLQFIRKLSGINDLNYNHKIASSEKETGYRNRALVNLMKDFGNIHNDVDRVLDLYFNLCSIEMTCEQLAKSFQYLSNHGKHPETQEVILSVSRSKRILAVMQTCGFYDEAGEFSFTVGLPGKSGVGGGIIAILPGRYAISVWSPRLNPKGNSYKGMRFLELFTSRTETSVF